MEGLGQICAYVAFIVLGYVLRRVNVLKADTVHALAGLVLYVTVPCLVIVSLNGIQIEAAYFGLIALGIVCNLVMCFIGRIWKARAGDEARRFAMINLAGYNIGTFAMPLMQGFVTPVGFLSICMFDVGNAFMCTGTTYSLAMGGGAGSRWDFIKAILSRMLTSGPIWAYSTMTVMAIFHWAFPDFVIDFARIGANANAFLAMIMIGQGINLSMRPDQIKDIFMHLAVRVFFSALISLAIYFWLPFDEDVRKALAILAFAPIPAIALVFSIKAKCDMKMAANFNSLSVATSVVIVMILVSVL